LATPFSLPVAFDRLGGPT